MTPENEIVVEPPTAERVGRELSRWFGNSDFETRRARRQRPETLAGTSIGPGSCPSCSCMPPVSQSIWVGFSWVALAVTLALYRGAHVRHHWLLSSLFFAPHLQDLARRAIHLRDAGRLGGAARPDLVGGTSSPPSCPLGQAGRCALARCSMAFSGAIWAGSCPTSISPRILSRVKDLLKYPELRFLDRFDIVVPTASRDRGIFAGSVA